MRFALEPYSEKLVQEMRPLWQEHHAEIPQLDIPIDPDLTAYSHSQKAGALRIYTARVGAGWQSTLLGYQVFFVILHQQRRGSLEAISDILYFDPEVRKGLAGYKFIRWCDAQLVAEGIKVIHHVVSVQKDLSRLFVRMGYQQTDITFARRF